jgi:hypothetical protein
LIFSPQEEKSAQTAKKEQYKYRALELIWDSLTRNYRKPIVRKFRRVAATATCIFVLFGLDFLLGLWLSLLGVLALVGY